MKRIFYFTVLIGCLLFGSYSFAQFVSINGQYRMDTVHDGYDSACCALPYYLTTPDTLSTCFLTRIHSSLPEGTSVLCFAPQYLYSTALTVLHLQDSGDVWLTYAGQGDWYENVLCFYTFPWGAPPSSLPDSLITVVFPNATLWSSGGGLHIGDKIYLGRFPANTGFGFALISNGWSNTSSFGLYSNRWRTDSFLAHGSDLYFSDPHLNKVASGDATDTMRHVVALYDSLTGHIVVGFEDRNRGGTWQPDDDFNDVLFYLSTNTSPGFSTTGYPHTLPTCDSSTGSGGGGGLESQSLGGAVSRRDYENMKNGITINKKPEYRKMPVYNHDNAAERTTGSSPSLERFLPAAFYVPATDSILERNSYDSIATTPYYSTPEGLKNLTIAQDVLSVDYVVNNQAKAVALAITTFKKAYNHTKSICDRFRGATLVSTDTIRIQSAANHTYRFILFNMLQPDSTTEYSITFDIGSMNSGNNLYLQSKWLITEYKGYDTVFNFQVWSNNPGTAIKLATQIINNAQALTPSPIAQVDSNFALPQSYIANGVRNKGYLNISLTNNTTSTNAYILFEENKTEIAQLDTLYFPVTMNAGAPTKISVPINDGYQYEGHLFVNNVETDVVYMADGNWSLDYDHKLDSIISYIPGNEPNRVYIEGDYDIYRSVAVTALDTSYMYAYKYITSGDEPVNLTNYKTLKFTAKGSRDVTIKLLKNSIAGIQHQYQSTISLSPTLQDYTVSLNDFTSDSLAGPISATDVVAIVFASDFYGAPTKFDFFAGSISFSPVAATSINLSQSKVITLNPNPTKGSFECTFYSETYRTLELAVSDQGGRIFYKQTVQANVGRNTIFVTLPDGISRPSVLMVSLENKQVKYKGTKLSLIK